MPPRRLAWLLIGVLSCLSMAFGPAVLTDGDLPRRRLSPQQLRTMRQVPMPQVAAASVMLVDVASGQVLYARNERERRAPASLVKIVTALVALRRGQLDQVLTVAGGDLNAYSNTGMQAGEKYTLREMLYILLVPSDNAASVTIARTLGGGDTRVFVGWMNALVAEWGLTDTHFANPHGLDNKDGYASAYDLTIIALRAMSEPLFAEIVSHAEVVVGTRKLQTTNELLSRYQGMIGIKTGTEEKAGECFIGMVKRPTGTVLVVIMGSTDRFTEARALLDYYYANFAELRIDLPDTPQNYYLDESHTLRGIKLQQPLTLLISPWQWGRASFYRRIDNLSANPDPAQPVGALEVTLAGETLSEVPIYAR
jgi:serine-type D-Ala-D-Ala carboxypeptidase (penicillin-binding protein 5/6)